MPIETAQDVKKLGSILCVFAHPDDETFTSAGLLTTAIKNGQKVVCVTATKGEQGVQDESKWPKQSLAEIRSKELEKALEILGIEHHYWLEYKDGECINADEQKAVNSVVELIEKFKPDTILTFGPDGMTGHDDHKTVGNWATKACELCSKKPEIYFVVQSKDQYQKYLQKLDDEHNIFFNIDKPVIADQDECDIYFELDDKTLDQKQRALRAMPSQTEKLLGKKSEVIEAFRVEAFIKSK